MSNSDVCLGSVVKKCNCRVVSFSVSLHSLADYRWITLDVEIRLRLRRVGSKTKPKFECLSGFCREEMQLQRVSSSSPREC